MDTIKIEKDYRTKTVTIYVPTLAIAYKIKKDIKEDDGNIWKRFKVVTKRTVKYI